MGQYRKRPVVITAFQWFKNGDHPEDDVFRPFEDTGEIPVVAREGKVVRYFRRPDPEFSGTQPCPECGKPFHEHGFIDTLEDGHRVCPGDFIITGVKGERYPCKPDIFEKTYLPETDEDLPFGRALELLKLGCRVRRAGWNGAGQYVVLMPGYPGGVKANRETAAAHGIPEGTIVKVRPYLVLHTAQDDLVPWAPSVSDTLAEDWGLEKR